MTHGFKQLICKIIYNLRKAITVPHPPKKVAKGCEKNVRSFFCFYMTLNNKSIRKNTYATNIERSLRTFTLYYEVNGLNF